MNEVVTAPTPAARKCRVEEVFDANFVELIRLVPKNPFVRALILKLTGKMPGPEQESFEQLKDWVEINCDKKSRPAPTRRGRNNAEDGIAINVEFSETEYGRADYSVPRSGSEEFRIGAEDVMEMVREAIDAGGGIDAIVEIIAGKIDDDAWDQCNPELDNYGDYDYSEHDANDSGNGDISFARNEIRNAVLAFVRERHPELAAEL
jgi:hypothetical protein